MCKLLFASAEMLRSPNIYCNGTCRLALLATLLLLQFICPSVDGGLSGKGEKNAMAIRDPIGLTDHSYAEELIKNVSFLLDSLLHGYNRHERPHETDQTFTYLEKLSTTININIFVRTLGPITEKDNSFVFDCYFRQAWNDPRLKFRGGMTGRSMVLSLQRKQPGIQGNVLESMLEKIWKPDTYFWNGKGSYLHKLTTPNQLVRLSEDGTVLYSSRLTVKSKCPMKLSRFPMDVQTCPLVIGSFGYQSHELLYEWTTSTNSVTPEGTALKEQSHFSLSHIRQSQYLASKGEFEFSVLRVEFDLERHMGYFIINFYIPCTLIVFMSWVALWINREATSDRIALGVTSTLTMTFISYDSRSDVPRVDSSTALDIYIMICFVFLFLCIIQFTLVHNYTKRNTGDPEVRYLEVERKQQKMSQRRMSQNFGMRKSISLGDQPTRCRSNRRSKVGNAANCTDDSLSMLIARDLRHRSTDRPLVTNTRKAGTTMAEYEDTLQGMYDRHRLSQNCFFVDDDEVNSASRIDSVARVVFPLGFFVTIAIYWTVYLKIDNFM